jgi:methylthioribose-1-phosphate isomerase
MRAAAAAALRAARRLHREDAAACRAMGRHGAAFVRDGGTYLTHCNTGALATAGQGTAFSVFVEAKRARKRIRVLVDETRPLLQGARLTALECRARGIPADLVCDNAAANGDFANKVGTYSVAVLAAAHGVPFHVVAPTTTIDPDTADGEDIVIEERDPDEVRAFGGRPVAPDGFDVTPAELVTALITERGVVRRPTARKIAAHLRGT